MNVAFSHPQKGKKYDLDGYILNNEKNYRKANQTNYWPLDLKWTLEKISLTTEHSHDIQNSLVLFGFTCWQLKVSGNLKKNVIKEANWVGGPLLMSHPVHYYFYKMCNFQ